MRIAGVDGCPAGWVAICADGDMKDLRAEVVPVFEQIPDALGGWPEIVAVDIPIGLADSWDRSPETEARRILGWPRMSSVFASPPRRLLDLFVSGRATGEEAYAALNQWSKKAEGRGLQRQTFHLLNRIAEVDAVIRRPHAPAGLFEVHPELAYWAMSGSPTRHNKHRADGRQERRAILASSLPRHVLRIERPMGSGEDDLLDALAALWSASRLATGRAQRVGACEQDPVLGRTIAIWY